MDQFKPSERELHYIAFIIQNYKEIFKPNHTLVKKIEQIEAQQRPSGQLQEMPQSKSMPVSIKPRNTPKKAAKLLGLDLEQVSASPINLKTVQTPNLPQDIKIISTSRVKLQRRVRNRPTIMTIEQQLKQQERARGFEFSDDSGGSPSKKQKDYDKLVDKLNLEEGASPMSEYQNSLSSEDLSSRKMTTSADLSEAPKVATPEVYIREKQRQREVLCAATKRNLPQKIHKSRKEHFHNHAIKIDIPNVPKFKNQYNEYNLDNDSTSSSAYCTDSSRTTSLQKTSSIEVLEEDARSRGRSHDSGTASHSRPKSKEIQRRNSGRRQRPVVKTANKCTVDRSRAKSDGRKESSGVQTPPNRQVKKVQPLDFTITPYKPTTPRPGIGTAYLAPNRYQRVVRRNSSNTSSERGRTAAIHRKTSSGKRNERPAVVTRSNSKRTQRANLVEHCSKHIRHEVRHANKISTATHNKET